MQTINIKGITPLMKANKSKKYNTVCFLLDNGYQVQTVEDYSIVNRLAKKYKENMKPFEKKLLDIFNNILPNNLIFYILLKI
jgi:ankyrin repeat protein